MGNNKRLLESGMIFYLLIIFSFLFSNTELMLPEIYNNEKIIYHNYYTLSYNEKHEQSDWVTYKLLRENLSGSIKRTDDFRIDPLIPSGSAELFDYKGSGYDRGHLAPAADFKWSKNAMSESFYMSNMSPQLPGFNRGIWKKLESLVRNWAMEYDEIYITTGPILEENLEYIGPNNVSVPKYYFKVILDYKDPEYKAIGFILPNISSKEALESYAITIDEVEERTGIDFFYNLPDSIEKELESNKLIKKWDFDIKSNNKFIKPYKNYNKLKISVQCSGITKKGLRCKKNTLNSDGFCSLHRN